MNAGADLRTFLQRVARVGNPEVRLVAEGDVLVVLACTSTPADLFDVTPLVLGARAFPLGPGSPRLDETVMVRALLDRIARMLQTDELSLGLPPDRATAAWAGIMPPRSGWRASGEIDAASLADVAREGVERVQRMLPEMPGEAVVNTIRRQVWTSEIAPGLPAATAFAIEALGFLHDTERVRLAHTSSWMRLSTRQGDVFLRSSGAAVL